MRVGLATDSLALLRALAARLQGLSEVGSPALGMIPGKGAGCLRWGESSGGDLVLSRNLGPFKWVERA